MNSVRDEVRRSQQQLLDQGIPVHFADPHNNRRLLSKFPDGRIRDFGHANRFSSEITLLIYKRLAKIRHLRFWRTNIS